MLPLPQDDARAEAAVWQAMVLFSTLSTAADVWHAARERRAGRDPSGQEPAAVVRPYLQAAAGELQALLMQLQAGHLHAERADEGYIARLVRRYDALMALRRAERLLHVVHQRLLSLYPAVGEERLEEARLLQRQSAALLEADDEAFGEQLGRFCHRGLVFAWAIGS